ncbi:MAG TPA: hypothetical protein VMW10_00655 [Alphaproteobacteria bacterium]|nr:hypothetical protein [Alphaproteobacteria bacterium]
MKFYIRCPDFFLQKPTLQSPSSRQDQQTLSPALASTTSSPCSFIFPQTHIKTVTPMQPAQGTGFVRLEELRPKTQTPRESSVPSPLYRSHDHRGGISVRTLPSNSRTLRPIGLIPSSLSQSPLRLQTILVYQEPMGCLTRILPFNPPSEPTNDEQKTTKSISSFHF